MIVAHWLGEVGYTAAWDLQRETVARLSNNLAEDHQLFLLEHPPTYTLGRNGRLENLLLDDGALSAKGITVHRVDRGGDITYHGPGQLVAYPIFNLQRLFGQGIGRTRQYVFKLEEVLISTLETFGIMAGRFSGFRGVWVESAAGMKKIAAIGVHVNQAGISSHGFALNVDPNLSYYAGIIPCGIPDHGVTSMAEQLDRPINTLEILPTILKSFQTIFALELITETQEHA